PAGAVDADQRGTCPLSRANRELVPGAAVHPWTGHLATRRVGRGAGSVSDLDLAALKPGAKRTFGNLTPVQLDTGVSLTTEFSLAEEAVSKTCRRRTLAPTLPGRRLQDNSER